jgi:Zn-dependent protease with chaperone function
MRVLRTRQPIIAHALGFGTIVVGRFFYRLPKIEQDAIIAHEVGHLVNHHVRQRVLWALQLRWLWCENFSDMLRDHEFEADAFAVESGHAEGLLAFISRLTPAPLYPSPQERIVRIHAIEGARRA